MDDTEELRKIRGFLIEGAAGAYAVFRLWRFHPACNAAYRDWLRLSPWTAGKPLPAGPVHLVWQDAAVIGALTAINFWHTGLDPFRPAIAFGFTYLVGLTFLLGATRRWWHCLALGFLWPSLMLPELAGDPQAAVLAAIVAVIWHGHRQSLRAFPWEFLKPANRPMMPIAQMEIRIEPVSGPAAAGARFNLGWPFMVLSPKTCPMSVSLPSTVAWSCLVGWWTFCTIKFAQADPGPEFILVLAIPAAFLRVATFCSNVVPPFNLWGRIVSGRIIVPGFDRVFLTPLAAVLAAILGVIVVHRAGSWYPTAEGGVIAVVVCLVLGGGPSLRNWVLTGELRFRSPNRSSSNKQMVRPV
jgi:hypothetical protein